MTRDISERPKHTIAHHTTRDIVGDREWSLILMWEGGTMRIGVAADAPVMNERFPGSLLMHLVLDSEKLTKESIVPSIARDQTAGPIYIYTCTTLYLCWPNITLSCYNWMCIQDRAMRFHFWLILNVYLIDWQRYCNAARTTHKIVCLTVKLSV